MKKEEIAYTALAALAAAGFIVAAATAPNAVRLLRPFIRKVRDGNIRDSSLSRSIKRMAKRRFVEFVMKDGTSYLQITEKGKKRLREFEFDKLSVEMPKKWRGVWTIVLFDIPESQKTARDALRRKLKELGCYQYHKSVFVHPAPCGDEIDFVAEFFQVSPHVIHFETPSLGSQEYRARRFFRIRGG